MIENLLILLIGFLAGATGAFVGGGGGLLSISFMILVGLPPHTAIAMNRFAAIGSSLTALLRFLKSDKIVWSLVPLFSLLGILGGIIGVKILLKTNEPFLENFTGLALICLAPLIFIKKDFGIACSPTPVYSGRFALGALFYLALMIFGGFFGAGIGILFVLLLVHFFGLTFIQSIATNNLPWSIMSITAFIMFAREGLVNWEIGIFLFIGMSLGGWVGADRSLHYGDQVVKKAFIVLCVLLGILMLLGYKPSLLQK